MKEERPVVAITMGDPVGVGPEIVLKALAEPLVYEWCRPVVFGDVGRLRDAAGILGSHLCLQSVRTPSGGGGRPGTVVVVAASDLSGETLLWGAPTVQTGRAMVRYILGAADAALSAAVDAVVTCPINKKALQMAGEKSPGHTELLARRTGARQVAMMMAGARLRVVLVTIHTALASVPGLLTPERVVETGWMADEALRRCFGIAAPRLAVAGFNPHGGEGGMFGDEEARVIAPAVEILRARGVDATGPHPPDTVFYQAAGGRYDAVVCMYHDQGLIPFKLLHFEDGVNVTLGLPIVRTSVDHGTAYDIAGTGKADCRSLLAAIQMAAVHAKNIK